MLYQNLSFPRTKTPYFYTNFVSTIDGKVQVLENTEKYWPLGSQLDYETLIELRTYADVLIHGAKTALAHPTLVSLSKPAFHEERERVGKKNPILYIVISNHPTNNLIPKLTSTSPHVKTMVITSEKAAVSKDLEKAVAIIRLGKKTVDLSLLPMFLTKQKLKHILVEGGPTLMGSFFKADLIDEIFLTITPKIVGNTDNKTLTMV